jgi:hypothetical protein
MEWRRTLRWVLKNLNKRVGRNNKTGGEILNCVLRPRLISKTLTDLKDCGFEPSQAFRILSDFSEDDYKRDYRFPLFLWLFHVPQEAAAAI